MEIESKVEVEATRKLLNPIIWNLRFMGLWPRNRTKIEDIRYSMWLTYYCIHVFLAYCDLAYSIGDLEALYLNLIESLYETQILCQIIIFRFNKSMKKIVFNIECYAKEEDFDDFDHHSIFMRYIAIATNFCKIILFITVVGTLNWFTTPLQEYFTAVIQNGSTPLRNPYRIHIYGLDLTPTRRTILLYILQIPLGYVPICFASVSGFFVIAVTNICTQLAILSDIVIKLNVNTTKNLQFVFKRIVHQHLKATEAAKMTDDAFHLLFFVQLVTSTVLLGLLLFRMLITFKSSDNMACLMAIMYLMVVGFAIFSNCFLGEFLQMESFNLLAAFYQSSWYDLPSIYKKSIIMCMIRAQVPMIMTAGKFYIFRLESFTSIMKSSMAYVSMMRTMI